MFIAYVMFPGNDINQIRTFSSEPEANKFGKQETAYPDRVVDGKGKYDPPVVLLFEAPSLSIADLNKYTRPVAIYQRGVRFNCVPEETHEP